MKTSVPIAATGILSQMYGNVDMILLGYFVGTEEVGYYSVAYKIVVVFAGIIGIYSQSTWPVMIRLYATDQKQLSEFLKQNLHTMLYFMIPVITGGTILAPNIIRDFFGEVYTPAVVPFILLLYYIFFMALSIMLANLLLAIKKDKIYFTTLFLGSFSNLMANLALIPYWRAIGSAMAMVIAELIILTFLFAKVKPLYYEKWIDHSFLLIAIGSTGIMGIGLYAMRQWFCLHVAFLIIMGAMIYLVASWPFCAKYIRKAN